MTDAKPIPARLPKPAWLKTKLPGGDVFFNIKRDLRSKNLFTVCEEAKCPNLSECWSTNTATFMILGDTCTRACRFCHVKTGNPGGWLDNDEPEKVASSCKLMGLNYAVITMVDRDDLPDGGAQHVAKVVKKVIEVNPDIRVEILGGDFRGSTDALSTVVHSGLKVYAHNIETVKSLTPRVRDARANYEQSLTVLRNAKAEAPGQNILTKSALMLGLGETQAELHQSLRDLRAVDVDIVTIGQYMRPTKKHLSIKRYVPPEEFADLKKFALSIGFLAVESGPLIRSSYKAADVYVRALAHENAKQSAC